MWESRRDFQGVWEGWEAGLMAFHAFHTLSFPWSAFRPAILDKPLRHPALCAAPAAKRLSLSVVNERVGDLASIDDPDYVTFLGIYHAGWLNRLLCEWFGS